MQDDNDRADDIYVAHALWRDGEASPGLIGFQRILGLLSGDGRPLSGEETGYLFRTPRLLSAYRSLKAARSIATMPAVAAASDGDLASRPLGGGTATLTVDRGQAYIRFVLDPELVRTDAGLDLVLENPRLGILHVALSGVPDDEGEMLEIVDAESDRGRLLVALLRDPFTTGDIVVSNA